MCGYITFCKTIIFHKTYQKNCYLEVIQRPREKLGKISEEERSLLTFFVRLDLVHSYPFVLLCFNVSLIQILCIMDFSLTIFLDIICLIYIFID